METLRIEHKDGVAWVWLNRPEVRNAFNGTMLGELVEAFESFDTSVRTVVLTGEGSAFCAGADLAWMAQSISLGDRDNLDDSRKLAHVFDVIDQAPRAVVGRINGPAMGGALGLMACCDIVVAVDTVKLAFSEVRLGIVPAVISPFVVPKIGVSAARRYFLSGESFDAATAKQLGLVHEVAPAGELDSRVQALLDTLGRNGPLAVGEAKKLIQTVTTSAREDAADYAVRTIARLRTSPEGQEGLAAFIEKRKPAWMT